MHFLCIVIHFKYGYINLLCNCIKIGSGILHEMHHKGYHLLEGVKCYSIYPSQNQMSHPDPQIEVFKLNHPIPVCESASPVNSYRWHSFSDEEFKTYQTRLEEAVYN